MIKVIDAKEAFEGFIEEAKGCADHGLGASAVLMAFSAMVAAGDADAQSGSLKKQIGAFVGSQYETYDRWLKQELPRLSPEELNTLLYEFRNGMSHVMSMPQDLAIVFNRKNEELPFDDYRMFIDIDEFIVAVESYVKEVLEKKTNCAFDKNKPDKAALRGPAVGTQINMTTVAASVAMCPNNSTNGNQ